MVKEDKFITKGFHIISLAIATAVLIGSVFAVFLRIEHRITVVETKLDYHLAITK